MTSRKVRAAISVLPFLAASMVAPGRARGAEPGYTVRKLPLPGGPAAINMDYIAFDPATGSIWAPAGNTGAVDVVDTATDAIRRIPDLPTAEMGSGERKRKVGPSSVTVGEGWVYVGNRADSSVCAFHPRTLERGACHRLDSMPDGVAYVAATKEVWVTTPRDKSIRILDADKLDEKGKLAFEGNPEGFAVDARRERFYTNLEDKDETLAINVKSRKTVAVWKPRCGEDGPHGLRVDPEAGQLFVACSARAEVLDIAWDGRMLASIDTGDGVDDLDYAPATHLLYVGAAKAGQLTIARADAHGNLTPVATVKTPVGARNPAVTDKGVVYLAHSALGASSDLVVVEPPK
jgi:DNA-binding beta-propeller fold protein YncE